MHVLCKSGFEYLIRIKSNLKVVCGATEGAIKDVLTADQIHTVQIPAWDTEHSIHRHSNENGEWYLVSNIKQLTHNESLHIYKNRFKIEKCFQDLKSAGFDMERSKIRKYSNYKRLLAIVMVAHSLLLLLGHLIVTQMPRFLKNSAEMAGVILAYFQLEERHGFYFQQNS